MNQNIKSQQIEFEVFPKDEKSNYSYLSDIKEDGKHGPTAVNVVFSTQSIIIVFICLLMSLIASFSLGVEKGKLIAKNNAGTQNTPAVNKETLASGNAESLGKIPAGPKDKTDSKIQNLESIQIASGTPVVGNIPLTNTPPIAGTNEKNDTVQSGYVIQIASVTNDKSAKGLSDTLIKRGIPSYTKTSGKYIIVLAGNFVNREEAQTKQKELKKTYTDCYIKKI